MSNTTDSFPPIKVLPWSPSSLAAFETCPRRVWLMKTKQAKEPQTEATLEGNRVHKVLENAVNGTEGLPHVYRRYQPIVVKLRATPGVVETERNFALTASFRPTGYWDKDAWVRGKIDVTITRKKTGLLLDYKTGKVKEDGDQAKLYAAVGFAERPHVDSIHTGYVWLAHNKVDAKTFTRADVPSIWQEFTPRVQRLVYAAQHNDFPPKPSGLCREWCPVGRKLCEFCGKA